MSPRFRLYLYDDPGAELQGTGVGLTALSLDEAIKEADDLWEKGKLAQRLPAGYHLVDTKGVPVIVHGRRNNNA
jgi:hypothetical protein